MKAKYVIWIIGLGAALSTMIFLLKGNLITGLVTDSNQGCCEAICQQTSGEECVSDFHARNECAQLDECNIGCCVDSEGYCLSNYLKGNCERKNGEFIASNECLQYPKCVTWPPFGSLVGFTGYPYIFPSYQKGIPFAEPISGSVGGLFTIKMQVFDKEEVDIVRAHIKAENYNKTIALYDDGDHNDGNPGDGLFAGQWQDESFPPFASIKKGNFTVEVNGNESKLVDYILLTSNKCLPITKPWDDPSERRDIVFIGSANAQQATLFNTQVLGIIGQMAAIASRQQIESINFYMITAIVPSTDVGQAARNVTEQCTFYNPDNDTIIFFDNNFDYCRQEPGMITTNPKLMFNRTAVEETSDLTVFIQDFCRFVFTEKQIRERIIEYQLIPNVTLITPQNNSYVNISQIEVSFMINDTQDDELPYEVYIDINTPMMVIANGTARNGEITAINVSIDDGKHSIWVEAEDSDRNLGHSAVSTITANVANFVVDVLSLDPLSYSTSPEVNFTISHAVDTNINYSLLVNNMVITNGTAITGGVISIPTSLENGTHIIRIVAHDSFNRTVRSLPYVIGIGEELS